MKVNDVFERDIEYLYNSAKELGGTIRNVACDSGFFAAVDYFRIRLDESVPGNTLKEDDIELVNDDKSYKLWSNDYYFLGNGTNMGWLCHNIYGKELVKPDIFAVEQAMNTYYAECLIRLDNPFFYIEKIDFDDAEIFDHISELIATALPANWLAEFLHGGMPESYKLLACQIAYIKYHYSNIYDKVWNAAPPYLELGGTFDEYISTVMGVAISENQCVATYTAIDGYTKKVYDIFTSGKSVFEKTCFGGTGPLLDIGLTCANLGLSLRAIQEAYKQKDSTELYQVNACLLANEPTVAEIKAHHETATEQEQMAYDAFELDDMSRADVVNVIADIADIERFHFIDNPLIPILKYYENYPDKKLNCGETAIVLYMDESQVMVGIATENAGSYEGIYSDFNTTLVETFNQQVLGEMQKIVQPKIDLLGIAVSKEDMAEFAQQLTAVKRQFTRNDMAKIVFNNGWLEYAENLSVLTLEGYYRQLMESCELLLQDLITEGNTLEYWLPDVKKIYLAGSMCDVAILWDIIQKDKPFGGEKELIYCGELDNVVTKGLSCI